MEETVVHPPSQTSGGTDQSNEEVGGTPGRRGESNHSPPAKDSGVRSIEVNAAPKGGESPRVRNAASTFTDQESDNQDKAGSPILSEKVGTAKEIADKTIENTKENVGTKTIGDSTVSTQRGGKGGQSTTFSTGIELMENWKENEDKATEGDSTVTIQIGKGIGQNSTVPAGMQTKEGKGRENKTP